MSGDLSCRCGAVHLTISGEPIAMPACYCTSCRTASARLAALSAAPVPADASGGTAFRMYRKDRVVIRGQEHLVGWLLTPQSKTRRVVAGCCNTPLFAEFSGGHWLSLYNGLWPDAAGFRPRLLTQTGDAPDPARLPAGVPHGAMTTVGFFARLFGAWAAMGFRAPKVEVPRVEVFPPAQ